jgi:hypothetical protein
MEKAEFFAEFRFQILFQEARSEPFTFVFLITNRPGISGEDPFSSGLKRVHIEEKFQVAS